MKTLRKGWLGGALAVALGSFALTVGAQGPSGTAATPATPSSDAGPRAAADGGSSVPTAVADGGSSVPAAVAEGGAFNATGATAGDAAMATSVAQATDSVASGTDGGVGAPFRSPYATAPMDTVSPTKATVQQAAPPPPPPSAEQVAALGALRQEMEAFEKGAKDYRDTVTTVIKLHYENKKREILSGYDRDITIEKEELRKARETAIKRLEDFVSKYSGPNAQPEATPDAMYRLAALYEERARGEDVTTPLEDGLKPAIALYKRIITDFPQYRELAGIYYFLGHAYNDSNRIPEAQQVWRSLVCHNKFPYPTAPDPKNPEADTIQPLPQDHDEAYWTQWRGRYGDPKRLKKGNPETTYLDPYPDDCQVIAQPALKAGEEPKYVAEIWWQIGNWEFDQLDLGGGVVRDEPAAVWDYNRAASAYLQSMKYRRPPLYGVALYKYAWALFKQQRYEAATREFVKLLLYTDEQQKLTGDPGADFRSEAYTYIAGSLTNVDFAGPGPEEPYIQRPDIIDTESRPEVAEKKLRVAIDRVKDPNLIPQDKPWTIDIYKSLATEFRSLNQFANAVDVYEDVLRKWPMDPSAPEVQASIAETYDQLAVSKRPGTPEYDQITARALEARTKLANYVGNTKWVDANKENPAAIQMAERLVRGGLRNAAVAHTNNGKAALVAANDTGDPRRQLELLSRAQNEYNLAAVGWEGYLKQDENAPDAYESRYWLADARRQAVRIAVVMNKVSPGNNPEPTPKDIELAKQAAVDVRDSNEDDRFLDNAALFVVDIADIERDLAYQRFENSGGSAGVERRSEVKFDSEGADRKVVVDKVPPVVIKSIQARDEYIARVPERLDANKNALAYNFYSGETFFLYGQFELARQRFEVMYKDHCGKDEYGYKAWEKLITMSNLLRDAERSRQLAEAEKNNSCAVSEQQQAQSKALTDPTIQEAAYLDARRRFQEAEKMPAGPERDKKWREAAALYEAALSAAPGRDEAPEAAMNAAYAYKQVGDFNKAIELYNKFISEYGSEDRLSKLQRGDPAKKTPPEPKKYQERLKYLGDAYDALSTTYYSFFNYQRAAETYDKVASNDRFDEGKRKGAARNAIVLFASMGQKDKMMDQYRTLTSLRPTPDEKANADFLVAEYDYKQWDPKGADSGQNQRSRVAGEQALAAFYNANKANPNAAKFSVQAAYEVGRMKKAASDPGYRTWFKNTIAAWEFMKARGPVSKDGKSEALSPPFSDYGAEAEFTLLDEEVTQKWDQGANRKGYCGNLEDVLGKFDQKTGARQSKGRYNNDAEDADKYDKLLEHVARTYPSVEWVPAAIARQGSLFDGLRTGLYNTTTGTSSCFKLFSPQQEAALKQMENSGRENLEEMADNLKTSAKEGFRTKKEQELNAADQLMVRRYASAVALARKYNVRNAAVEKAIQKLAYYTDIIGNEKMREYVTQTADPTGSGAKLEYKDSMYVQSRPGKTATPPAGGQAVFAPVAP